MAFHLFGVFLCLLHITVPSWCQMDVECTQSMHHLYPDPNDCQKFTRCVGGKSVTFTCPPLTAFDPDTQVCSWRVKKNGCGGQIPLGTTSWQSVLDRLGDSYNTNVESAPYMGKVEKADEQQKEELATVVRNAATSRANVDVNSGKVNSHQDGKSDELSSFSKSTESEVGPKIEMKSSHSNFETPPTMQIDSRIRAMRTNQPTSRAMRTNEPTSRAMRTNPPTSRAMRTNPPTSRAMRTNPPTSRAMRTNEPTSRAMRTNEPTSRAMRTNPPTSRAMRTNQPTSRAMRTNQPTSRAMRTNEPTSRAMRTNQPTTETEAISATLPTSSSPPSRTTVASFLEVSSPVVEEKSKGIVLEAQTFPTKSPSTAEALPTSTQDSTTTRFENVSLREDSDNNTSTMTTTETSTTTSLPEDSTVRQNDIQTTLRTQEDDEEREESLSLQMQSNTKIRQAKAMKHPEIYASIASEIEIPKTIKKIPMDKERKGAVIDEDVSVNITAHAKGSNNSNDTLVETELSVIEIESNTTTSTAYVLSNSTNDSKHNMPTPTAASNVDPSDETMPTTFLNSPEPSNATAQALPESESFLSGNSSNPTSSVNLNSSSQTTPTTMESKNATLSPTMTPEAVPYMAASTRSVDTETTDSSPELPQSDILTKASAQPSRMPITSSRTNSPTTVVSSVPSSMETELLSSTWGQAERDEDERTTSNNIPTAEKAHETTTSSFKATSDNVDVDIPSLYSETTFSNNNQSNTDDTETQLQPTERTVLLDGEHFRNNSNMTDHIENKVVNKTVTASIVSPEEENTQTVSNTNISNFHLSNESTTIAYTDRSNNTTTETDYKTAKETEHIDKPLEVKIETFRARFPARKQRRRLDFDREHRYEQRSEAANHGRTSLKEKYSDKHKYASRGGSEQDKHFSSQRDYTRDNNEEQQFHEIKSREDNQGLKSDDSFESLEKSQTLSFGKNDASQEKSKLDYWGRRKADDNILFTDFKSDLKNVDSVNAVDLPNRMKTGKWYEQYTLNKRKPAYRRKWFDKAYFAPKDDSSEESSEVIETDFLQSPKHEKSKLKTIIGELIKDPQTNAKEKETSSREFSNIAIAVADIQDSEEERLEVRYPTENVTERKNSSRDAEVSKAGNDKDNLIHSTYTVEEEDSAMHHTTHPSKEITFEPKQTAASSSLKQNKQTTSTAKPTASTTTTTTTPKGKSTTATTTTTTTTTPSPLTIKPIGDSKLSHSDIDPKASLVPMTTAWVHSSDRDHSTDNGYEFSMEAMAGQNVDFKLTPYMAQDVVRPFECPSANGHFPDPRDCAVFYHCDGGVPYRRDCPSGEVFHAQVLSCVSAHLVGPCHTSHEHDTSNDVWQPECHDPNGLYSDPGSCRHFYECTNGWAVRRECMTGTVFDEQQQKCTWSQFVPGCEEVDPIVIDVKKQPVFICPRDGYFRDADRCDVYFLCAGGDSIRMTCNKGTSFDITLNMCVWTSMVPGCELTMDDFRFQQEPDYSEQSNSVLELDANEPKKFQGSDLKTAEFVCPYANGLFPHPEDCNSYFECSDDVARRLRCPYGSGYHEDSGLCLDVSQIARCVSILLGSNTQVLDTDQPHSSYECPSDHGLYPDPSNCSVFIHCFKGQAYRHRCQEGTVYSPEVAACTWSRLVPGCVKGDDDKGDNSVSRPAQGGQLETGSLDENQGQEVMPVPFRYDDFYQSEDYSVSSERSEVEERGANFQCENIVDGYHRDGTYCDIFHRCVMGTKFTFTCPEGTFFRLDMNICDFWDTVLDCTEDALRFSATRSTPEILREVAPNPSESTLEIAPPSFPGNDPGYDVIDSPNYDYDNDPVRCPYYSGLYAHPRNCRQFLLCAQGVPVVLTCPKTLLYNPQTLTCDYAANVACIRYDYIE